MPNIIRKNIGTPQHLAAIIGQVFKQVFEGKRLAVHPQNGIPGFSLHFPLEPSYGYLRFDGNGLNSFGKAGKKEFEGKGI